ncbi:cysteine--tRNA ligase [Ranunculus cassubicifolius]
MSDDLHTQDILKSLLDALHLINKTLDALKKSKQKQAQMFHSIIALKKEVKNVLEVLGLLSTLAFSEVEKVPTQKEKTFSEVLGELKEMALNRAGLTEEELAILIEERVQARIAKKDYAKSDQIRFNLTAKGIALMDLGKNTIWRPCVPGVDPATKPTKPVKQPTESVSMLVA